MKRKALLLIIPFASAGLAGCQQANPPTPAPQCDSATVSITSAEGVTAIKPGEQLQLTAQVNLDNCSFSWDSTNKSVATVDSNGLVTAISVGETTIKYGSGEFELSVEENPAPHVTEVLSVKSHPQSVMVDGSIEPSSVILNVKLSDGTETTKAATRVDCDTSKAADSVEATAWYNQIGSAKFNIKVTSEFVPEYGTEDNPLTVTQALATIQAECPEDNTYTKQAIYCTGTITEVTSSGEYEGGDFWFALKCTDGTTEIVVYRIHTTEAQKELIKVGAQIKWVGFAKNFKGTLEFVDSGSSKCTLLDSGTPTPQKEVVEVLSVKSHPESVTVGGSISPSSVILNVKLSDGTETTKAATQVDCDTSKAADSVEATAWYNQIGSAKFNIKVVAQGQTTHAGTEADPYDSADAASVASALAEGGVTQQSYYIKGTVEKFEETFSSQYGNYSFNIGNNFICWRLKNGSSKANFNEGDIEIGDEVVVYAQIQKFHQDAQGDKPARNLLETKDGYVVSVNKGGEQKEVNGITAVSYTKTLYVGGTINPSDVTLTVSYSDGTSGSVKAQRVDGYSTATAGNTTATAHYGTFEKNFVVEVKIKPAPTGESSIYTFTNDKTSSQNMAGWTSEQFLTHVVVDGDEVITGIKDVTNAYIGGNGGSGDTSWNIWNCFKVGKSNAGGTATLTLDSSIVFESIKVSAIGNRDDGTLTINGVTKNVTKKAEKGNLEPMELEFEVAGGISELTFSSKEASSGNYGICITKIEFVGGGTPTPQKTITGVELQGTLEKSSYIEGQTFDPSGLSLKVTYNEGDPDVLTSGFTFNVTNPLAVGEYDLKATYQGHTTEGSVHISVVAKELVSIAITHGMNQTTYQDGSDWNATGIVVQGTYNDGDIQTISSANYELSYSPEKATGTGSVSVNIFATMSDGSGIKSEAYPQTVTIQEEPVTEPELVNITIEGSLTKSDYKVGETYSAAGLSVLGHYDNESTKTLDVAITFNKTVAALGDTAIIASVEYEDLSDEKEFTVTVTKVDENVIDVSSVNSYSITSDGEGLPSSYGDGSNTNFAWTGLYKGQNDSIQGNSSKSSELHNVRAFSKEITYIKFNVGYAAGDAATGEIRFGSSAQPTGNAGKYGANTDYSLTKVGSFVLFAPSASTYLSVVWTKGASYFSSIDVHFDEYNEEGSAVDSVSLNKDSITLGVGSSETLVPTISPSDAANKQVTWESSDEDIATVDSTGKVTAVAEGTATITVTTKDGGKTDTCSVTVTKASEGGSTAIDLGGEASVIFDGVTYEKSLKAGTGKVAGSTSINVPSGAKKLVFYAAGWNGETVKISVTGGGISQTLSLTSDSGVSGNGPYTIGSTTESNFKFEIDVSSLTGATTLTLAATSGNRFVVWNASYTK